jgi:hypothetical protein
MEESEPDQATPMTATLPLKAVLTRSTEGASALHVLQVGAQNHSAMGRPA